MVCKSEEKQWTEKRETKKKTVQKIKWSEWLCYDMTVRIKMSSQEMTNGCNFSLKVNLTFETLINDD